MTLPSLILRLEALPNGGAESPGESPAQPSVNSTPLRAVVDLEEGSTAATPLARWSAATAAAHDACLVLDPHGAIVSISAPAAEILGCSDAGVIGRRLLDVIDVVDLEDGSPDPEYASRITPLAVLNGRGLMRSLLRIRHTDDALTTVDTASSPLHDASGQTVGSVTFLASIASL